MTTNAKNVASQVFNGHNDAARVRGMIDATMKLSGEFAKQLSATAAACAVHLVLGGRPQLIHELYDRLKKEQPEHAGIMRSYFVPGIMDRFAQGGKKDEATGKWIERPTPFIRFNSRPNTENGETYFTIISWKDKNLSAEQQTNVYNAKKALQAMGADKLEEAFTFKWKSIEQEEREADAMSADVAKRKMLTTLKALAKEASTNGVSKNDILETARRFGLSPKDIKSLDEAFASAKERLGMDEEEYLPYEPIEPKDDGNQAETPKETTKAKEKREAAHA